MLWKIHNFTVTLFLILALAGCQNHLDDITDDEAIAILETNRHKFDSIVEMLNKDFERCKQEIGPSKGCRISIIESGEIYVPKQTQTTIFSRNKVEILSNPTFKLPPHRIQEYMDLTNSIGLERTTLARYEDGHVRIGYRLIPTSNGVVFREFNYNPHSPTLLYDHLEIKQLKPHPSDYNRIGYRKIDNEWYLYLEANGALWQ